MLTYLIHSFLSFLWKDPDEFERIYEPLDVKSKKIHVVDSGLTFNLPYPLILRPQRGVDLIISFDFSARPSDSSPPFKVRRIYVALHYLSCSFASLVAILVLLTSISYPFTPFSTLLQVIFLKHRCDSITLLLKETFTWFPMTQTLLSTTGMIQCIQRSGSKLDWAVGVSRWKIIKTMHGEYTLWEEKGT